MANGKCGCKPCRKPFSGANKKCKPFQICVGNYTLTYDGNCPTIQERTIKIPDGTYTSITFVNGCITGVGEAPIPQYTPQQCCDAGADTGSSQRGDSLSTATTQGNLAVIKNNELSVTPQWDAQGNIQVQGQGTADRPWKPSIRISRKAGNTLVEEADGLFANLFFKTTNTVTVNGDGTKVKPYELNVVGADAKLPVINKTEIDGNGFTIDTFGRWKVDDTLNIVTNLKIDHPAFSVIDQGASTLIAVNAPLLQNGVPLQVGTGLTGAGTKESPVNINLNAETVGKILDVIQSDSALTQRLKTIIGV